MDIFKIKEFDYNKRIRNLDTKASGVVSSTKYFPVFEGEKIFKPLSKTKPLSTPLFSYSEVYWSYLINKYIDSKTPIYVLSYCYNLEINQSKYYEKGCIVDNILKDDEYLVNLLEFFKMYPDNLVDIDDYVNYCEVQYDYTPILNSAFFKNNQVFGRKLAEQILCSILRRDDNYHYENVSLIFKDGKPVDVAPIIDLEFSQMFMYPDDEKTHKRKFSAYDEGMSLIFTYDDNKSYQENMSAFLSKTDGSIYDSFDRCRNYLVMKNINTIVSLYPDLVLEFIDKIKLIKEEVKTINIEFDSAFLGTFSSNDWEPIRMLFKENKTETDKEYIWAKRRAEASKIRLDENKFNERLRKEILWNIDKLINVLMLFLNISNHNLPDITKYNNDTLYGKIERYPESFMELLLQAMVENDEVKQKRKGDLK